MALPTLSSRRKAPHHQPYHQACSGRVVVPSRATLANRPIPWSATLRPHKLIFTAAAAAAWTSAALSPPRSALRGPPHPRPATDMSPHLPPCCCCCCLDACRAKASASAFMSRSRATTPTFLPCWPMPTLAHRPTPSPAALLPPNTPCSCQLNQHTLRLTSAAAWRPVARSPPSPP